MNHADFIRDHASPLEPIPTGESPSLEPIPGLKGVVFDIYGTLIISAAGDISLAGADDRDEALRLGVASGSGVPLSSDPGSLTETYHRHIRTHQQRRRDEGIEFPEAEIREVWRDLLAEWNHPAADDDAARERMAVAYEVAVNPVWPMPGLGETLADLRAAGLALGIVSNAQFYTPHLFPAFLDGRTLPELGFAEALQVYSFRLLEGKPSRRLYEVLAQNLAERGIGPGDILYVGNDLRNDIWPAQAVGFRTALFAGDRRSLRWREEDPRVAGVHPDRIVTDLGQLREITR